LTNQEISGIVAAQSNRQQLLRAGRVALVRAAERWALC
jgi:hypothetical protein